ncbi:MAG: cyclic nucleotide-binding domain-containing protein, partial [Anaerolineae bacterium]|nr:cyclic nucleotide-binding domain-containing protein [Anaerolineae bacterium]
MADRERIVPLLKTTYPFHKLDEGLINVVADAFESVNVPRGQRIYREGSPSDMDGLCLILEGKVRLVQTQKGQTRNVAVLGEGEMFG